MHVCPGEASYIEVQGRPVIKFEVPLIRMAGEYEDMKIIEICNLE